MLFTDDTLSLGINARGDIGAGLVPAGNHKGRPILN
jgi:hypothetical protein